jgi:hypothetical protein
MNWTTEINLGGFGSNAEMQWQTVTKLGSP